jgi:6-phosphogluconolactonase/glucosamine-6-phosphate isomerase/deaminase
VVLVQGASKKKALDQVWAPEGSEDEAPARVLEAAKGNVTWIVGTESLPA